MKKLEIPDLMGDKKYKINISKVNSILESGKLKPPEKIQDSQIYESKFELLINEEYIFIIVYVCPILHGTCTEKCICCLSEI